MAEKNTYINGKLWNLGDANGVIANASQIKVGESDVETELSKKLEESNLENYATKEYVDEKSIKKYDDISSAEEDLANGVLKLGDIISVGIGATFEYTLE